MRKRIIMEGSFGDSSLPINVNSEKAQGCYANILEHTEQSLDLALQKYSKVLIVRFDLHLPDGFNGSAEAVRSKFFSRLISTLKRSSKSPNAHRNHKNIWYGCVIEYGNSRKTLAGDTIHSGKPHYHCWMAVSGHKIKHPGSAPSDMDLGSGVMRLISDVWLDVGGSYVWRTDHHFLYRSEGKGDRYREAFNHLSYIAKTRDKYFGSTSGNQFTGSRLGVAA
jgi:hypothetical protein